MQLYADRCLEGRNKLFCKAIAAVLMLAGVGIMGNGIIPPMLTAIANLKL